MPRFATVIGRLGMAAAAAWLLAAACAPAQAATFAYRCTNPASGASWDLVIDPDRQTVDALPATITERWISWRELPHGGYFDLDRATGRLRARYASSTGGYFLTYDCRPG